MWCVCVAMHVARRGVGGQAQNLMKQMQKLSIVPQRHIDAMTERLEQVIAQKNNVQYRVRLPTRSYPRS